MNLQTKWSHLLKELKASDPKKYNQIALQVRQKKAKLLPAQIEKASKDCHYFVKHFALTLDEHDKHNPIKHFPDKDYIWDMVTLFNDEQLLLIEKSRQMMATWTIMACCLWEAMFTPARRIFVQSKKELDANNLVDRCKFIYDQLPQAMKDQYPMKEPRAYLKLEFPKWHSIIQGVPQGSDMLRQYTASRVVSDEMAFQEKSQDAYISLKPTLDGGGSFVGISSPNGKEFFYLLAKNKI